MFKFFSVFGAIISFIMMLRKLKIAFGLLIVICFFLFNVKLNAEEKIIIPTSTPIQFQKAETAGPNYGAAVNLILDNLRLGLALKCQKKMRKETSTIISNARSKIKSEKKFNLVLNYTNCSASLNPFAKGPYLTENSEVIVIELFPFLTSSLVSDIYFIFPKKNKMITGDYFKLEGVTPDRWHTIIKNKLLELKLKKEYQTVDYVKTKIRKGRCGYLYSKKSKSGKLKVYSSSYYENYKDAESKAKKQSKLGYSILEVVCNL